jgi:adenine-specific DNA-methyltransferase
MPEIKKLVLGDPDTKSADIVSGNVDALKELFPEAFKEGQIDFDVLRQLLGGVVNEKDEKYGLNWHGKRKARQIALTPSTGTLLPCPEESVDWDTTQNLMIEGDNLEVLKLLRKSHAAKVKLIYIDPPYNQDADVIYVDDFTDNIKNYKILTGQLDGDGRKLLSASEASGRYHTEWLNMMYPRLKVSRDLLSEDGVIMVSIDDGEIDKLKEILSEIFGYENFLATLIWNKQHSQQQGVFKRYHEFVVCYAKNISAIRNIEGGDGEIDAGALKKISKANPASEFSFPAGVRFDARDGFELAGEFGDSEKVTVVSGRFICKNGVTAERITLRAGWTQKNQMESWFSGKETIDTKGQKVIEFYFNSAGKLKCRKQRTKITPSSILPEYGMVSSQTAYLSSLMGAEVFQTPKPVQMLVDFISWFLKPGDVVMDFFAGSGTTGEALYRKQAELEGSKFVLVQLPEPLEPSRPEQTLSAQYCDDIGRPRNIAELTKERLRRAAAKVKADCPDIEGDLGFRVYKLATSNIVAWDPEPTDLEGTLLANAEHLVPGRTEQDVLYELLLKLGLDLCVPIEKRDIGGKTVHSIGGGALIVCLADGLTKASVETVANGIVTWRNELTPAVDTRVVFKDSGFVDDVAKANMAAILNQNGILDVRSL